jgi:peptidoglycan hydrolase CwlO-like protein
MKEGLVAGFFSVVSAVTAFFIARKKNKAEVRKVDAEAENMELQSVEKAVGIWRALAADLVLQITSLKTEVEHLRKEVEGLRRENKQLKKTLDETNKK